VKRRFFASLRMTGSKGLRASAHRNEREKCAINYHTRHEEGGEQREREDKANPI
jgi:hypothetical protein